MSLVITTETAEALRHMNDLMVETTGQVVQLHHVSTTTRDTLEDAIIRTYSASVATYARIEWSPDSRLIKALGLRRGKTAPVLAYMKFSDNVKRNDYITVKHTFRDGDTRKDDWDIVDIKIGSRDVTALAVYILSPRGKSA